MRDALLLAPGLVELLPSNWNDAIGPYLPSNATNAFMTVQTESDALSPGPGLTVFACFIVVLLTSAAVPLKRRDGHRADPGRVGGGLRTAGAAVDVVGRLPCDRRGQLGASGGALSVLPLLASGVFTEERAKAVRAALGA